MAQTRVTRSEAAYVESDGCRLPSYACLFFRARPGREERRIAKKESYIRGSSGMSTQENRHSYPSRLLDSHETTIESILVPSLRLSLQGDLCLGGGRRRA